MISETSFSGYMSFWFCVAYSSHRTMFWLAIIEVWIHWHAMTREESNCAKNWAPYELNRALPVPIRVQSVPNRAQSVQNRAQPVPNRAQYWSKEAHSVCHNDVSSVTHENSLKIVYTRAKILPFSQKNWIMYSVHSLQYTNTQTIQ